MYHCMGVFGRKLENLTWKLDNCRSLRHKLLSRETNGSRLMLLAQVCFFKLKTNHTDVWELHVLTCLHRDVQQTLKLDFPEAFWY